MKINSDISLKIAADTFRRFAGDWTAVHQAAEVDEDGDLVIRAGAASESEPAPRRAAGPAAHG